MSEALPVIHLARHGETTWSLSGQHTSRTDLPLTERGERNARALGERLLGLSFARVFISPLQRAVRTCELAGFGGTAGSNPDLFEWDYGQYEGRRTAEIHAERPDWLLFRDGCPGGESPDQVGARGRTASSSGCAPSAAMCCYFRAGISYESWQPVGSVSMRRRAATFSLAPPASARWATNTILPSRQSCYGTKRAILGHHPIWSPARRRSCHDRSE
jgi:hypothetical protein